MSLVIDSYKLRQTIQILIRDKIKQLLLIIKSDTCLYSLYCHVKLNIIT